MLSTRAYVLVLAGAFAVLAQQRLDSVARKEQLAAPSATLCSRVLDQVAKAREWWENR